MNKVEFYSYNTTNFNSIFYNNHWFCLQGLYFHFENFLGLDFWIDIFQLELLSVLIFNLDLMLMVDFIVLIYNFNGNFVKCTSGGVRSSYLMISDQHLRPFHTANLFAWSKKEHYISINSITIILCQICRWKWYFHLLLLSKHKKFDYTF